MVCNVCTSEMTPNLVLKNKNGTNHIFRCSNCRVTFVNEQPKPAELNSYYNGMYKDLAVAFDEKKMNWALNSMEEYVKRLGLKLNNIQGKSFLDLGGGLGYYSKAAYNFGFNAILVEKDPISVNFASKELNLENIIKQDLDEFFLNNNEKYDVVFFRHVIEHVTNPFQIMKGISSVLKDNGILIIETDNNAGIEILFTKHIKKFYLNLYDKSFEKSTFLNLLKKRPFALDPPRHLYGFRMKNLSNLLLLNDIRPYCKIHYRLGHPYYWPNIPSPSLKSVLKNIVKLNFKTSLRELNDWFNLVFRRILQRIGFSSGLCIYGIKKIK